MDNFDGTHQVAYIYDPTAEGGVRKKIVECYIDGGLDVTTEIVDKHTRLLMNVVAINHVLMLLNDGQPLQVYERAIDNLKHYHLPRAQAELARLEERLPGIKNYRSYRTPIK